MVAAIERASLDDLDQLIKLRLAYLADDFGALDPEQIVQIRETLPGYLHKHLDTDLLAFVARAEDGYPLYRSLGFSDDSTTHKAMRLML